MLPRIAAIVGGLVCLLTAVASVAVAQGTAQRASFINPFPKSETYRLHLVGDWFADGLLNAVADSLSDEGQIQTQRTVIQVRTLRRSSWDLRIAEIDKVARATPIDIAVVMFGAAEIGSLSVPGRRRVGFASEEWKVQYIKRVDRVMKALRQTGAGVYWLGMPTLRRADRNDAAQFLNEIFRERAYINGVKYIDVYSGFADENGGYSPFGPDLSGKIGRLRSRDGVYFTAEGYRKLAHYAERQIRRDLRKAKSERTVPLAGSELEQSRVNPRKVAKAAPGSEEAERRPTPRAPIAKRIGSTATSAPAPVIPAPGLKEQKADDSVIALRTIEDGVARTDKIKILRPAIPAAVLALITRKQSTEKAARLGDNVAVEIAGGVMVLSSVTPVNRGSAAGARGRLSPSQSPFFKVWAKGERLTPRPGRADDIQWPRPEPKPVVRAKYEPTSPSAGGDNDRPRRKFTPYGFPPLPEPNPRPRAR